MLNWAEKGIKLRRNNKRKIKVEGNGKSTFETLETRRDAKTTFKPIK